MPKQTDALGVRVGEHILNRRERPVLFHEHAKLMIENAETSTAARALPRGQKPDAMTRKRVGR